MLKKTHDRENSTMGKIEELATQLRNELKQGKFKIGDRFPSEYELAEIYRVNNKTANKASALLVADGFLRRGKRGEGTFVRQTEIFPEMNLGFIGRLNHPYYCSILDGFQSAAFDAGYLTCIIYPRPENLGQTIMKLNTSNIAGYVCNGFELIENLNKPVIFSGKEIGQSGISGLRGMQFQSWQPHGDGSRAEKRTPGYRGIRGNGFRSGSCRCGHGDIARSRNQPCGGKTVPDRPL